MRTISTYLKAFIILAVIAIGAAIAYAYSGLYEVSVGSGHNALTGWYIETLRERSVEARAADLRVPGDLHLEERVQAGAGHYKEMCTACHGHPGRESSRSYDPAPPALYRRARPPTEAFQAVKHGIKMTAMPHHRDHSDADIWNIVAFLNRLPEMDKAQYEAVTADAEHVHADGEEHGHDAPGRPEDESHEHDDEHGDAGHEHETPETAAATLDAFHHALKEGDREDALQLLHPSATVLEGGHLQTKDQYAAGHLESDMAFLGVATAERLGRREESGENQARIETRTRLTGTAGDRDVDLVNEETATLVRTDGDWRIAHLNWRSTPAQEGEPDAETGKGENETADDG